MLKSIKKKFFATLCIAALTLGVIVPTFANTALAAPNATKTIYVDVEKNITGQAPIKAPVAVTLSDTATIADATKQAVGDNNISITPSSYGPYVAAFKDATPNFVYPYESNLRTATNGVVYSTDLSGQKIITDSAWLKEKEYTGISGWMFTVNNTDTYGNGNYYTAGTSLSNLPAGSVIRWEFSMASGADLGLNTAYLPTAATAGYYDWNTSKHVAPFFARADKTALITKLATTSKPSNGADGYNEYKIAQDALKNLTISQANVDKALTDLNNAL